MNTSVTFLRNVSTQSYSVHGTCSSQVRTLVPENMNSTIDTYNASATSYEQFMQVWLQKVTKSRCRPRRRSRQWSQTGGRACRRPRRRAWWQADWWARWWTLQTVMFEQTILCWSRWSLLLDSHLQKKISAVVAIILLFAWIYMSACVRWIVLWRANWMSSVKYCRMDNHWLLSLVSMDSVPFLRICDLYCKYGQF